MKNITLLLLSLVVLVGLKAQQDQNLAITGASLSHHPMPEASAGIASFNFDATQGAMLAPEEVFTIKICGQNIEWNGYPTGAGADLFEWEVSPTNTNCFIGTRNTNLSFLSGGNVFIAYLANGVSTMANPGNGFTVDLTPHLRDPLGDLDDKTTVLTYSTQGNPCAGIDIQSNFSKLDQSALDANNGLILVNPTGGQAPYSYTWNAGTTNLTESISDLLPGTYQVVIMDANGCSSIEEITIDAFSCSNVNLEMEFDVINAQCFGENTGAVLNLETTGGLSNYLYDLKNSNNVSVPLNELSAGTYTLDVVDKNLCTKEEIIVITEPSALEFEVETVDANAENSFLGSASINVVGGIAPYSYNWLDFPTNNTAELNNVSKGKYLVNVIDANGCSTEVEVEITEKVISGIADVDVITLAVFPNPSSGDVTLTINNTLKNEVLTVQLYDIIGSVIYNENISVEKGNKEELQLSNLASGVYLLNVSNEDSKINFVEKLVVRK